MCAMYLSVDMVFSLSLVEGSVLGILGTIILFTAAMR